MRLARKIPFALAALLSCSGCIPMRLQETPHLTGAVLDAQTRQPLVGAKLYYEDYPKRVVHTSPDGSFDFPAIHAWQLIPLAPYDRFCRHRLIAEADGYQPTQSDVSMWRPVTNQVFLLNDK